ncbi:sugar phosphate isomerase/epimerase family protein [Uliginosibacterium sp. sgz301328]|uniref:sugar phosphate isomerase/epimerase family protein n=1 Tax=Uliginosibacterium sp. sgz301328 TaxID=3243764 RepID=UPI00359EF4D5
MRDLATTPECLSINTATFGHRIDIDAVIDLCQQRGIGAIAPWRRDLEGHSVARVAARLRTANIGVSGYCRSTYFTHTDEAGRRAALEDNMRAVDDAAELGATCFVLVVGGIPAGSRDLAGAREQVQTGVAALLEHARKAKVPLALEPLHPMTAADRSCLSTLGQALDWCDEIDPCGQGLGVAVDVYHVWWDPALQSQIVRAMQGRRVLGYHVSDWLVPTNDLVLDRGMMGDGVIDLKRIRGWLEDAGYDGAVEVEIFSAANWWKRPATDVLDTCIERLHTVC